MLKFYHAIFNVDLSDRYWRVRFGCSTAGFRNESWFLSMEDTRGKRKKVAADDTIPCVLEPELTDKDSHRNWARLIQKIYEVDPLVCPKCADPMRVIALIEDEDVIRKILKYLDLWDNRRKPAPRTNAPPAVEVQIAIEDTSPSIDELVTDPVYPAEAYF